MLRFDSAMKDKGKRFERVAEARTIRVIVMMRRLARCANKTNYKYGQEQADKIVRALEDEVARLKGAFGHRPVEFTLQDDPQRAEEGD